MKINQLVNVIECEKILNLFNCSSIEYLKVFSSQFRFVYVVDNVVYENCKSLYIHNVETDEFFEFTLISIPNKKKQYKYEVSSVNAETRFDKITPNYLVTIVGSEEERFKLINTNKFLDIVNSCLTF